MTKSFAGIRTRSEWELLHPIAGRICELRKQSNARALLVGLSGIDASGKGYLATKLENLLCQAGLKVALIGIDGWLNLPHVRFSMARPGEHFYEHGIRLAEMFEQLKIGRAHV